MPAYEYQCQSCKKEFTALRKISEPAPSCLECGGAEVKKKLPAPAVRGGGHGCGVGGCGHRH